jgi:hypothetical protein
VNGRQRNFTRSIGYNLIMGAVRSADFSNMRAGTGRDWLHALGDTYFVRTGMRLDGYEPPAGVEVNNTDCLYLAEAKQLIAWLDDNSINNTDILLAGDTVLRYVYLKLIDEGLVQ